MRLVGLGLAGEAREGGHRIRSFRKVGIGTDKALSHPQFIDLTAGLPR
jgi:hypothetical protein